MKGFEREDEMWGRLRRRGGAGSESGRIDMKGIYNVTFSQSCSFFHDIVVCFDLFCGGCSREHSRALCTRLALILASSSVDLWIETAKFR